MEGRDNHLERLVRVHLFLTDGGRHSGNKIRIIGEGWHSTDGGLVTQLHQHPKKLVIGRGGGGCTVLGVERQANNTVTPLLHKCAQRLRNRRAAIAHSPCHRHTISRQLFGQLFGLMAGVRTERAFVPFRIPHTGVSPPTARRTRGQDHTLQQWLPEQGRALYDPPVG